MMLTTKSRYAVMALVEVAAKCGVSENLKFIDGERSKAPVRLADISESQDIPLSYLEQIFHKLKRAEIVGSVKGPGGGYLLNDKISDISIINIVDAVEENTKMTRCGSGKYCTKDGTKCKTHDLWKGLGLQIRTYLSSISIADVLAGEVAL